MASAVERGATAVRSMDRWDIFIWLGKIFYGLLYRELFLPLDRSGKSKGSITSKPLLKRFAMHHMFLQCVRVPLRFEDFFPASILIVSTQEPGDPKLAFDFRDDLGTMCITCRIGKVGLIGVLQDGGAQQQMFSLLRLERRKLHPIQFTEVVAQVIYKATLMNRVPKYLTIGSDPIAVIQMPLQGFSTRPIFDDWDQYHYAQCLSQITGVPMAELYCPPGQVMTWLRNPDGSSKRLSVKRSRSIHRMAKAPKGL